MAAQQRRGTEWFGRLRGYIGFDEHALLDGGERTDFNERIGAAVAIVDRGAGDGSVAGVSRASRPQPQGKRVALG